MCDTDELVSIKIKQANLPESWNDALRFAAEFYSLMLHRDGTVWVRRGVGDLLHILGFYAEQHPDPDLANRLMLMSDILKHIAQNLDRD